MPKNQFHIQTDGCKEVMDVFKVMNLIQGVVFEEHNDILWFARSIVNGKNSLPKCNGLPS